MADKKRARRSIRQEMVKAITDHASSAEFAALEAKFAAEGESAPNWLLKAVKTGALEIVVWLLKEKPNLLKVDVLRAAVVSKKSVSESVLRLLLDTGGPKACRTPVPTNLTCWHIHTKQLVYLAAERNQKTHVRMLLRAKADLHDPNMVISGCHENTSYPEAHHFSGLRYAAITNDRHTVKTLLACKAYPALSDAAVRHKDTGCLEIRSVLQRPLKALLGYNTPQRRDIVQSLLYACARLPYFSGRNSLLLQLVYGVKKTYPTPYNKLVGQMLGKMPYGQVTYLLGQVLAGMEHPSSQKGRPFKGLSAPVRMLLMHKADADTTVVVDGKFASAWRSKVTRRMLLQLHGRKANPKVLQHAIKVNDVKGVLEVLKQDRGRLTTGIRLFAWHFNTCKKHLLKADVVRYICELAEPPAWSPPEGHMVGSTLDMVPLAIDNVQEPDPAMIKILLKIEHVPFRKCIQRDSLFTGKTDPLVDSTNPPKTSMARFCDRFPDPHKDTPKLKGVRALLAAATHVRAPRCPGHVGDMRFCHAAGSGEVTIVDDRHAACKVWFQRRGWAGGHDDDSADEF